MIKEKEKRIINLLRKNSRTTLSRMSKELNIPVSTIFESIKKIDNYILKHSSIINNNELGFSIKAHMLIKSKNKEKTKAFLESHKSTNNLHTAIGDYDLCIESIFKDMKDFENFKEKVKDYTKDIKYHFIVDEIKKEGFLL